MKSKKLFIVFMLMASMSAHAGFLITELNTEDFEDANETLLEFIGEVGAVISYTSHAHKMLERTAPAMNPGYNVYTDALIHLFCTAPMAHEMVTKNPHVLSYCPYSVAIYKLTEEPETVYLSYRANPDPIFEGPMALLGDIVSEMKEEYAP
jgi:uncharacterized protein (DUF302 family)